MICYMKSYLKGTIAVNQTIEKKKQFFPIGV